MCIRVTNTHVFVASTYTTVICIKSAGAAEPLRVLPPLTSFLFPPKLMIRLCFSTGAVTSSIMFQSIFCCPFSCCLLAAVLRPPRVGSPGLPSPSFSLQCFCIVHLPLAPLTRPFGAHHPEQTPSTCKCVFRWSRANGGWHRRFCQVQQVAPGLRVQMAALHMPDSRVTRRSPGQGPSTASSGLCPSSLPCSPVPWRTSSHPSRERSI